MLNCNLDLGNELADEMGIKSPSKNSIVLYVLGLLPTDARERFVALLASAIFDVTCLWQPIGHLIDRTLCHLLDLLPTLLTIDLQLHVHFIKPDLKYLM